MRLLHEVKERYLLNKEQKKFKKLNKHNYTKLNMYCPAERIKVGNYVYGELNVHYYGTEYESLVIGGFCSIAPDVHFFLAGGHDYNHIMTYPFKNKVNHGRFNESTSKGPIVIDDDVWIGYGATILSGVHIGQGAVIGAGSVVAKDIPPYAIYAGGGEE